MKFYHPERAAGQLLRLCKNDECTCAEGECTFPLRRRAQLLSTYTSLIDARLAENCSMQKKGKIENFERTAKSCETTPVSKIDFGKQLTLLLGGLGVG